MEWEMFKISRSSSQGIYFNHKDEVTCFFYLFYSSPENWTTYSELLVA